MGKLAGQPRDGTTSGRELAAELGELALLALVEHAEGGGDALRVLREEPVDELLAERRERDGGRALVGDQAPARDEAARLERRDDLGRVGLRRAQPRAQG